MLFATLTIKHFIIRLGGGGGETSQSVLEGSFITHRTIATFLFIFFFSFIVPTYRVAVSALLSEKGSHIFTFDK